MPDDIRKGSPTEPPFFRQQRAWARQVNQELRTVQNRTGIRVGAGVNRERPIDWQHALDFRGKFANKAEYSDGTHDLVIAAGRVVKPTSIVTVAETTVAMPVSGNLCVYIEVTLATSNATIQSASTLPDYVQDYNTINIPIGILTETTTGHWSWTQYHQGAVFLQELDYTAEYGVGFWGKIESGVGGIYAGAVLKRDGATDTTAEFSNASEVSGREGIPNDSTVWIRPTNDQSGIDDYVFEYHGAAQGTPKTMLAGAGSAPKTDTWDRSAQGSDRGVVQQVITRLITNSNDELIAFCREKTYDANGHLTDISEETEKTIGALAPGTVTCTTGMDPDDSSVSGSLAGWWKADAITGLSDTDSVSSWPDSSGNGRTMTQGTSSKQPVYRTNQYNNLPAVRFDGIDDILTRAGFLSGTAFTIFFVAKQDATAFETVFSDYDNDPVAPAGESGVTARFNSGGGQGRTSDGTNGGNDNDCVGGSGSTALSVFAYQHVGIAEKELFQNGSSVDTSTTSITPDFSADMTAALGGQRENSNGGAENGQLDGDICEVVVYSSALTDEEVEKISCGLEQKWGI